MRDTLKRLQDIQDAILHIKKYTDKGRHAFDTEELVQIWVFYYLQIIGEAARAISQEFKDSHQEIPWKSINGMRNLLVHAYFAIDLKVVWEVVEKDLPILEASIDALLSTSE